jgi:hypothetical protein
VKTPIALLSLLCVASAVCAAPVPKVKPAEVELLPLATELFVGDPFEAFVRFTNRGEDEVFLYHDWHLRQHVGNVSLEVKGPRDKEFRCPYTTIPPGLTRRDGPRTQPTKGVKAGGTRCEFVTLPWRDTGGEEERGRFEEAGEWQVRGKVEFHSKEEKVSSPVVVKVIQQPPATAKRFAETVAELDIALDTALGSKFTTADDSFKARVKLNDDLGACYRADQFRRIFLGVRLDFVGTERSKETADEVMKDIDTYLKTAPQPVRDRFCWTLAYCAHRRAANDPQAIKIGRKYLALVECLPDYWQGMDTLFDEAERKLKAKPPEKKGDKK